MSIAHLMEGVFVPVLKPGETHYEGDVSHCIDQVSADGTSCWFEHVVGGSGFGSSRNFQRVEIDGDIADCPVCAFSAVIDLEGWGQQ